MALDSCRHGVKPPLKLFPSLIHLHLDTPLLFLIKYLSPSGHPEGDFCQIREGMEKMSTVLIYNQGKFL